MNRAGTAGRDGVRLVEEPACALRSIRLMKNPDPHDTDQPGLLRAPDEWKTGDEPMTDAQLETLCRETGEAFDETMSRRYSLQLLY
jgi:hypothetical protein